MSNRMQELIERGLLVLGEGVVIEDYVVLCQQEETNEGPGYPVVIGSNTRIRSGAVLYEGVHIGSDCCDFFRSSQKDTVFQYNIASDVGMRGAPHPVTQFTVVLNDYMVG